MGPRILQIILFSQYSFIKIFKFGKVRTSFDGSATYCKQIVLISENLIIRENRGKTSFDRIPAPQY